MTIQASDFRRSSHRPLPGCGHTVARPKRTRPARRPYRSILLYPFFCCWAGALATAPVSGSPVFAQSPAAALQGQATAVTARAEELLREGKAGEALPLLLEVYRTRRNDFKVCHQVGLAYTRMQQFDRAAEFYRDALRLNPAFVPSRKNLATVLWFSDHKAEAEREFLSVTKALPGDPVPHFYLGSLQYERRQFSPAKAHFELAGELAFSNPEALPMVLETYLATGDLSFPDRVMRQLQQAGTPDPELAFRCATLFAQYSFYPRAIAVFELILSTYPDRRALFLNLGSAQLEARQYRDAVASLEIASSSIPADAEVFRLLGDAYDKVGNPEKAYGAYTRAIGLAPRSEEGYIALSSFAVAHRNDQFALQTLSQGLEKIPGSTRLLLQQGTIWALQMNFPRAEESFHLAGLSDPQSSLPLLALGLSQMQGGELSMAADTFRRAAGRAPNDFRPEYFYALALIRAGGRSDPARTKEIIASLEKAIALNPQDAESRVALGQTYQTSGRLDLAVRQLQKALQLEPANTAALYQLSTVYRRQGKTDEAERLLRTFEEMKAKARDEEEQERKALVQIMKTVR